MEKKCIIEKVYERSKNVTAPTLLTFQNGNLTVADPDRVQYCNMTNNATKSTEAFVAVDSQIYTGPINPTEQLVDTYVCVRNKSTNKVRIIPLDQANLKNYIYSELQKQDITNKMQPLSQEAVKKKLSKEFRGRKAANSYETTEKMLMSVDIIKDELDITVQETDIKDEDLFKLPASSLEVICPKCNKDATTISEVYDINDLMPANILDRLDSEANAVLKANIKTLPIKSTYLLSLIGNLKKENLEKSELLLQTKIIIFMDCLFNFLKSNERKIRNIELSGITEKIEFYMRRTFLNEAIKTSTLSDKALCYYIVLCLLSSKDNSVNVSMLAEELGKSKANILTYAHLVNALPNRSQSDVVTLRLPKQVPALKAGFRKRRQ